MFHPLFPEQDAEAEVGRQERAQEGGPPEHGRDPHPPGNGLARGEALVEPADEVPVGDDRLGGDVLEEELLPTVLGRGEVMRGGDHAHEVAGEPLSLHAGCDRGHGADGE